MTSGTPCPIGAVPSISTMRRTAPSMARRVRSTSSADRSRKARAVGLPEPRRAGASSGPPPAFEAHLRVGRHHHEDVRDRDQAEVAVEGGAVRRPEVRRRTGWSPGCTTPRRAAASRRRPSFSSASWKAMRWSSSIPITTSGPASGLLAWLAPMMKPASSGRATIARPRMAIWSLERADRHRPGQRIVVDDGHRTGAHRLQPLQLDAGGDGGVVDQAEGRRLAAPRDAEELDDSHVNFPLRLPAPRAWR